MGSLHRDLKRLYGYRKKTSTESKLIPVDETKNRVSIKSVQGVENVHFFLFFFYSVVEYLTRRLLQVAIK